MIDEVRNTASSPAEVRDWARTLLDRVRSGDPVHGLLGRLAGIEQESLAAALPDDACRKAFWINLYNAGNLLAMKGDPRIPGSRARRMRHFMRRSIRVAGKDLSLMQIENGLLRRGRVWWGLGYLSRPFPGTFLRAFRVKELDPRIHFALNCGAVSCPPIRFYHEEELEAQLETATRGFMVAEVRRKPGDPADRLYVSPILRMYQGDFGGHKGIVEWVRRYREDLGDAPIRLAWLPYDWTPELDHFA